MFPQTPLHSLPPRVFGSICFVHNLTPGLDKLFARFIKYSFLGYMRSQNGYRCFSPTLCHYLVSVDVTFCDDVPLFASLSLNPSPMSEVLALPPLPMASPPIVPMPHLSCNLFPQLVQFMFIIVEPLPTYPLRQIPSHYSDLNPSLPRTCYHLWSPFRSPWTLLRCPLLHRLWPCLLSLTFPLLFAKVYVLLVTCLLIMLLWVTIISLLCIMLVCLLCHLCLSLHLQVKLYLILSGDTSE